MTFDALHADIVDLKRRLTAQATELKSRGSWLDLSLLPHSLWCCHRSLLDAFLAQERVAKRIDMAVLKDVSWLGLDEESVTELSFPIDTFFESARRCQNALIHYLSRALQLSLRSSLSDVVKDIEQGRIQLDSAVARLLTEYWRNSGSSVKDYRDTSQHHSLIAPGAKAFLSDNMIALRYLLPSNPSAKASSKLLCGQPSVHALPFIQSQFLLLAALIAFLVRFMQQFAPEEVTTIWISPSEAVTFGGGSTMSGHRVAPTEEIEAAINNKLSLIQVAANDWSRQMVNVAP